ncbi:MAG: hypothetical protein IJR53_06040 [Bacteroidales bacterium]|nr:hypothetical protein [Bacteroidales bacterium]
MAEEKNTEKRNNPKFHHKNNRRPWDKSRGQEPGVRDQESGVSDQGNNASQNSRSENKVESKKVETRTVETNKPETDKMEAWKKETRTVEARKTETDKMNAEKTETGKVKTNKPETGKLETNKPETDKMETKKMDTEVENSEPNTAKLENEKAPKANEPVSADKEEKTETSKIESKVKEQFSDKDHSQVENLDQYLDMDIRTGSNPEADAIAANIFLTRGLNEKPDVETPHCREYRYNCCKLATYDWIEQMDIATDYLDFNIAEVRFKNSHKDFYILPEEGVFRVGDIVAVEASPGHDIGIISMLGLSVKKQLEHKRLKPEDVTKKLYRIARVSDIDKWISTVDLEHTTMLSSRYIAWDLDLKMKVNDVEYQGDGTKAIFYYSAEERVDFRELIKILAEQFRIRIEMRQIGVRQEAARLGGIGTCGRELCCSAWLTNFQSVSTNTARTQQLSLNPQKLAGMCGKLKCCLNFEQSTYIEESKGFPAPNVHLKTKKGKCFYNKIDIFKKIVWYSYADDNSKIFAIPLDKVNEIIKMNSEGKYPETLEEFAIVNQAKVEEGVSYSMDELKRIEDK